MNAFHRHRLEVLGTFTLGLLILLGGAAPVQADDARQRPNILFIFTDDHAYQAISAYGSQINQTPHLDRLAREGMLFRHCMVTNSICGPSRAVIQTGKHSHFNGFLRNGDVFDGSQQTFPKLLGQAGYQTAVIGKWHLESNPQGFDFWEVLPGQGHYYNPDFLQMDGGRVRYTGYVTDLVTDMTLDWLQNGRDQDKPFMVMCQHKAPHREWSPGPDHLTMYDDMEIPEPPTLFDDYEGRGPAAKQQEMEIGRHMFLGYDLKVRPEDENSRDYRMWQNWYNRMNPEQRARWDAAYEPKNEAFKKAGLSGRDLLRWKYQRYIKDYLRCIASVDDNVGRLMKYLQESGLAENTVVIYASDQGFYLGEHGWYDKRWMYEQSLRTPLIVRWPGTAAAGSENTDLTSNLDFAQTFLEMAGVEQPEDMQGRSLVPLLKGHTPDDRRTSVYYHYYEYPAVHMVHKHCGVRTDRYKLMHFYELDAWELYDLEQDPHELQSVYGDPAYAEVVQQLKRELQRLQQHYGEPDPQTTWKTLRQQRMRDKVGEVKLRQVRRFERNQGQTDNRLDPSWKPLTVSAVCRARAGDGVLIAHGGASWGYSLYLKDRVPYFSVRSRNELKSVAADEPITLDESHQLTASLGPDGKLRLWVDGRQVAEAEGHFIEQRPNVGLSVGADLGSQVGDYDGPLPFDGELTDIRLYWGQFEPDAARQD